MAEQHPELYYRVDTQFRSGASESFDARKFGIEVSNIGLGAEAEWQADHLLKSRTWDARAKRFPFTRSSRSGWDSGGRALLGLAAARRLGAQCENLSLLGALRP